MTRVISIVGQSNSGKTTLLEKVVRELNKRGYRIGTVKHDTHGFEIDYPGKDSYRHFRAGSEMAAILGPDKIAIVKRLSKPLALDQALKTFFADKQHHLDLIITEGFKREPKPKIEVVRKKISSWPICRRSGNNLAALVTNVKIQGYPVPQFGLNEINKITDFIEEKFICPTRKRK